MQVKNSNQTKDKTKVLFVHNRAMWYRIPFFNLLSKDYNVKFVFTREHSVSGLNAPYEILTPFGFGFFKLALNLITLLWRGDYDVVVFPSLDSPGEIIDNFICFIICKLRNKRYIIWSEAWKKKDPGFSYKKFKFAMQGFLAKRASSCVASGSMSKSLFKELGIEENKIFISPYSSIINVKPSDCNLAKEIESKLGIRGKKVILYVGRLIKRKGVDYLIKAFGKIAKKRDDVVLIIIGGKGYYGKNVEEYFNEFYLEELCINYGIKDRVHFLGDIKNDELAPYYILSDLFVLPALSDVRVEAWGLVINEAMGLGKPVIATNAVGAAFDLIENNVNGFIVHEKSIKELSDKMEIILSDDKLRKKMGEENMKKISSEFTYDNEARGFEQAIEYAARKNNKKILVIHNKATWYRQPLFNILSEKYDIQFVFTREQGAPKLNAKYKILNPFGIGFFKVAFGIIPILLKEKYDYVFFPSADSPGELLDTLICYLCTKIRRKEYFFWTGAWKKEKSIYKKFKFFIMGLLAKKSAACIVYGTRSKILLKSFGVQEDKIFIAWNTSMLKPNSEDFKKSDEIKFEKKLGKKQVVLFVGRLVKRKGIDILIKAFSQVVKKRKDARLIIIGEKGYYGKSAEEFFEVEELRLLCKELGIEDFVLFLGDIKNKELLPYYLLSDLVILPAVGDEKVEAWGLVINEAMGLGKPVIATNAVGAAFDLIENNVNGFIVHEKSIKELSDKMEIILSDDKLRKKMGEENTRKINNRFTYNNEARGFEQAIEYVISNE